MGSARGRTQSEFTGLVIPATRGLSTYECARLVPTYNLESAVTPSAEAVQDIFQERFETPRSFARARIVGEIQRLTELRIKDHEIPGSRFRNFHSATHLRGLVTRRLAFPAYVFAYRYRGQLYRTVISGQDPNCVIGEAPRSMAKLIMVILAVALALGLVVALLRLAR